MAKYKLEDILNEYGPDGKRSGIRRDENKSLAHGTLETEKLIAAATSRKPLSQQRSGYHSISNEPPAEETQPKIWWILNRLFPVLKPKKMQLPHEMPTFRRCCANIFRHSICGGKACLICAPEIVRVMLRRKTAMIMMVLSWLYPNRGRSLLDRSTARTFAKWRIPRVPRRKKRRRKRNITESSYAKESMTGVMHKPGIQPETDPQPRHHWDAEQDFLLPGRTGKI